MKLSVINDTRRVFRFMFVNDAVLQRGYDLTIQGSLCLLLLFGLGCAAGNVGPTPILVKRTQMHMGTWVSITAVASDRETAQNATSAGFQEIHRLEELLSTWIKDSELSRVNGAAGKEAVSVSPDTMKVLQTSVTMARLTEGGFNILVGPAVEAWSVLDRQQIPSETDLERIRPLTNLNALQLNQAQGTVYLEKPGMRVDVGGIGKGFAADMAVASMQKAGAAAGVVALSGDIRTFGQLPDGTTFPFGIRHPRREEAVLAFIDLQNEAISTAGDYERYFERDGIRYHHVLDPVTLQPARDCQSVTIVAKDGLTADGLDTGIFVMGRQRGLALVETLPGVGAVIVDREGKVWVSSSIKGRVRIQYDAE
ncbi:MAG: FAD:protein FMN transferase [Nitrospira sp.]|nr:MAG: FAD:protein FMN transferase [Nitrospira sp.]